MLKLFTLVWQGLIVVECSMNFLNSRQIFWLDITSSFQNVLGRSLTFLNSPSPAKISMLPRGVSVLDGEGLKIICLIIYK